MKLAQLFKAFSSDETGAVTVDWVVLTAAIVGLGMVVVTSVGGGIETMGTNISDNLGGQSIGYTSGN
ncbi:pilus assembly protein [Stagnihabitans tardus]|uniref:Pilus assembly protein n=1 Tax=Stagnihabitans tardus TaxID=2699202 RepID=A0AAE5BVY0_9RHOB|nr:pilus assembly protein [Stagnihabitans tardus]NBZ88687.1 pilus assembly protein [Stagnihabitans tardus]NBZ88688.1 pilus assembly protein [Stagnihabitans tardus]